MERIWVIRFHLIWFGLVWFGLFGLFLLSVAYIGNRLYEYFNNSIFHHELYDINNIILFIIIYALSDSDSCHSLFEFRQSVLAMWRIVFRYPSYLAVKVRYLMSHFFLYMCNRRLEAG